MIRKLVYLIVAGVLLLGLTAIPVQAATPEDIEDSIVRGLEWLAAQQQADGRWDSGEWWAPVAETGFALVKLCDRAYETGYSPFDLEYEYAGNVTKGFDYLFSEASAAGVGIAFDIWGYENYCTGIAAMAIAASRTPDRPVPTGPYAGQTYKDVLQGVVDYFAWAQCDAPAAQRGGWSYGANQDWADQSNTGYSVLGLRYAEAGLYGFGCVVPQVVKDEHTLWVNFIQRPDGGSDYDGTWNASNLLRTGNLLFEQSFVGLAEADARVQAAIGYIEANWSASPDSQAMYCLMKGLESYGIKTITVGGNPVDWYDVFADHIIANQHADGYFENLGWGVMLDTVFGLLTLEKFAPPPPTERVKVTGGGTVDWPNGGVTYGFTAQRDASGVVKGEAQFRHHGVDARAHTDVLYLAVSGTDAWIGAVITQSDDPALVGQEIYFRVQDNGEGKKATGPDAASEVMLGPAITALSRPALALMPWTNGNVQIHVK